MSCTRDHIDNLKPSVPDPKNKLFELHPKPIDKQALNEFLDHISIAGRAFHPENVGGDKKMDMTK
jgi:hypothetical protein